MIAYVSTQLSIWGKAQRSGARSGLGWPSVCPMFRDVKHGGVYGSAPPVGVSMTNREAIDDTDAAVQRLAADMRQLAVEYYVVGGTGDVIAARMGISKRTLYYRMDRLHHALLGMLLDVVAGVPPEISAQTLDGCCTGPV